MRTSNEVTSHEMFRATITAAALSLALAACSTQHADPIVGARSNGGAAGASLSSGASGRAGTSVLGTGGALGAAGKVGAAGALGSAGGGMSGAGASGTGGTGAAIALSAPLPSFCTADGWCGSDLTFSAIWGAAPDDVWVTARGLGDNTTASAILHWNGAAWTTPIGHDATYYTSEQSDLAAIWGASANDVWFAGTTGNLLHWDGAAWKESYVGANNALTALWGSGPRDIWAVGAAGAIFHHDGTTWQAQSGPNLQKGLTTINLAGLWGSGPSDVWAVGDGGAIFHFDGSAWRQVIDAVGGTPTSANLKAVWGSGPGDVWAVGTSGTVLHSDGKTWAIVSGIPTTRDLSAVWGSGPGDVWVAGAAGTLLHFAGGAWFTAPHQVDDGLLAVWGSSAGDLWAAGERAAAVHWDRVAWAATAPRPIHDDLLAVAVAGPNDVWISGANGMVAHLDQQGWHRITSGTSSLAAIWVPQVSSGQSPAVMVGGSGRVAYCSLFEGIPSCYDTTDTAGAADLTTMWGTDVSNLWAGGRSGHIWHTDGNHWSRVTVPTTENVSSMWGSSANDVWAATVSAQILHFDGVAWTSTSLPGGGNSGTGWQLIAGTGPGDVWVAGWTSFSAYKAGGGYAVNAHWDGTAWGTPQPASSSLGSPAFSIGGWSPGASDLWTVAPNAPVNGAAPRSSSSPYPISHWSAGAWAGSMSGSRAPLRAIAGVGTDVWAVGDAGTILRRTGSP